MDDNNHKPVSISNATQCVSYNNDIIFFWYNFDLIEDIIFFW